MSSIRLFILSSFDDLGPMHGHRLRLEAERKHVPLWTDIPVGAVYAAMKRLAAEGLLQEVGEEREGARPTRRLYEMTDEGRLALHRLRREELSQVWFKYDPFDLALTRCDAEQLDSLHMVIADRLKQVRGLLAEARRIAAWARPDVGLAKQWALRHTERRLEADVCYLEDLLQAAPGIADEERSLLATPAGT